MVQWDCELGKQNAMVPRRGPGCGVPEVKGGPREMEEEPRLLLNCCVSVESCSASWSLILCTCEMQMPILTLSVASALVFWVRGWQFWQEARQLQTSFIILLLAQDIQHTVDATCEGSSLNLELLSPFLTSPTGQ